MLLRLLMLFVLGVARASAGFLATPTPCACRTCRGPACEYFTCLLPARSSLVLRPTLNEKMPTPSRFHRRGKPSEAMHVHVGRPDYTERREPVLSLAHAFLCGPGLDGRELRFET